VPCDCLKLALTAVLLPLTLARISVDHRVPPGRPLTKHPTIKLTLLRGRTRIGFQRLEYTRDEKRLQDIYHIIGLAASALRKGLASQPRKVAAHHANLNPSAPSYDSSAPPALPYEPVARALSRFHFFHSFGLHIHCLYESLALGLEA
jgi:hypothetical protein